MHKALNMKVFSDSIKKVINDILKKSYNTKLLDLEIYRCMDSCNYDISLFVIGAIGKPRFIRESELDISVVKNTPQEALETIVKRFKPRFEKEFRTTSNG